MSGFVQELLVVIFGLLLDEALLPTRGATYARPGRLVSAYRRCKHCAGGVQGALPTPSGTCTAQISRRQVLR
jgi:hypothetical protein